MKYTRYNRSFLFPFIFLNNYLSFNDQNFSIDVEKAKINCKEDENNDNFTFTSVTEILR